MSDTAVIQSETKKGSAKPVIIACCLLIVCFICVCCSVLIALLGGTAAATMAIFNEVQGSVVSLCSPVKQDLRGFYDKTTSKQFKRETSFVQFQDFYDTYGDIIIDCSSINDNNYLTTLVNGANVDYSNKENIEVFTLKYNSKSKVVTVQFIKEGAEWKINLINIE